MAKKRNYELDFWKFVASIFVVLYHSHSIFDGEKTILPNGYLTVELFLIISGFFFASSVYRDVRPFDANTIGKESWCFICKKIKAFLFYYIFGFVGTLIADCIADSELLNAEKFPGYAMDFLLARETGIPFENIMGSNWYLSAMVIAMFILYPLFRFKKQIFSHIIAPILAVSLFGYVFAKIGTVGIAPATSLGLFTGYTLLAISEICMGVVAFAVSQEIKKRDLSGAKRFFLSVADIVCVVGAFLLIIYTKEVSVQPFIVLLFFLFVLISGTGKAGITSIFTRFPCVFLGKLSLALYLSHSIVRGVLKGLKSIVPELDKILTNSTDENTLISVLIYLAFCMLLAVTCVLICNPIYKASEKKRKSRI